MERMNNSNGARDIIKSKVISKFDDVVIGLVKDNNTSLFIYRDGDEIKHTKYFPQKKFLSKDGKITNNLLILICTRKDVFVKKCQNIDNNIYQIVVSTKAIKSTSPQYIYLVIKGKSKFDHDRFQTLVDEVFDIILDKDKVDRDVVCVSEPVLKALSEFVKQESDTIAVAIRDTNDNNTKQINEISEVRERIEEVVNEIIDKLPDGDNTSSDDDKGDTTNIGTVDVEQDNDIEGNADETLLKDKILQYIKEFDAVIILSDDREKTKNINEQFEGTRIISLPKIVVKSLNKAHFMSIVYYIASRIGSRKRFYKNIFVVDISQIFNETAREQLFNNADKIRNFIYNIYKSNIKVINIDDLISDVGGKNEEDKDITNEDKVDVKDENKNIENKE